VVVGVEASFAVSARVLLIGREVLGSRGCKRDSLEEDT
jgi:hypothetical protein